MVGMCLPMASVSSPRARVSLMPAAHLLMVLKVAGDTMIAVGGGRASASWGCLYWLRTTCPVSASTAGMSMKAVPCGVVMTHTSQPSAWAMVTRVLTCRVGGAAQAMM
ncbi:MAG: hypothetical protein QG608_1445 [Actinomycetota bacterium]|nr:hypothetical protein [Actinomycetota bacterium]